MAVQNSDVKDSKMLFSRGGGADFQKIFEILSSFF